MSKCVAAATSTRTIIDLNLVGIEARGHFTVDAYRISGGRLVI